MALSTKQTKSQEQSDNILKMRKAVLEEIKKDEGAAMSRQTKEDRGGQKTDQTPKRSIKKKKIEKQKKISAPKPKTVEKTSAVKEVNNDADNKVKSVPKKEKTRKKKVAATSKEGGLKKQKPCFFYSKSIQDKKSDSSEKKIDLINSVIRKGKEPMQCSKIRNIVTLFFAGLALGCLLFAAIIFYTPKSESLLARKISKIIPLPAIIINGKFISYNDYLKEVDTVDLFLVRQQRIGIIRELPPHAQIRQEIKDLLIKQEIITSLTNQYKITVSQKEIDDEIEKIKEQSRSEESFDEVLKNLYNWSEDDFGDKVVRNYLLISKLSNKIFPDVPIEESKNYLDKKIEEIKKGMDIYVLVK